MVTQIIHRLTILLFFVTGTVAASAQEGNSSVKKGNDAYKNGDYSTAEMYYRKALTKEPGNISARFNLGNAMEKQKKAEQAAALFNDVASSGKAADTAMKAKAFYNKGVALVKDNKLPLAIDAFKQALRLAPDDEHARENLQKAMNEMKQQQQQNQNQNQNQQQKEQPQQEKEEKKPEKSNSKLNQKQAEQMLGQLRDNEKQLQKKIQKGGTPPPQNKKDW